MTKKKIQSVVDKLTIAMRISRYTFNYFKYFSLKLLTVDATEMKDHINTIAS